MLRLLLPFLLLCLSALAQNPTGSPEDVLAGINIHSMHIADVQKIYGQQEAVYAVPPGPYPEGTKLYKWGRLTVTLKVLTEPSINGEVIRAIQVEGQGEPGDKPINKTGRGLKLKAKATDVKKIYGVDPAGPETSVHWPDVQP